MKIRITAIEEVLGSSPSNEDLLGTYIASKAPNEELSAQEVDNIKAQQAEDRVTVFPKLADGTPFIWDYQIKGMFKDSCKMLAKAGKAGYPGGKACAAIKAYKQAIDGLLFLTPREIPFNLNGMKLDYCERSLRADTPMGREPALRSRRASRRAARWNLRLSCWTRSWKPWCGNAWTTASCAGWASGVTRAKGATSGRK